MAISSSIDVKIEDKRFLLEQGPLRLKTLASWDTHKDCMGEHKEQTTIIMIHDHAQWPCKAHRHQVVTLPGYLCWPFLVTRLEVFGERRANSVKEGDLGQRKNDSGPSQRL